MRLPYRELQRVCFLSVPRKFLGERKQTKANQIQRDREPSIKGVYLIENQNNLYLGAGPESDSDCRTDRYDTIANPVQSTVQCRLVTCALHPCMDAFRFSGLRWSRIDQEYR